MKYIIRRVSQMMDDDNKCPIEGAVYDKELNRWTYEIEDLDALNQFVLEICNIIIRDEREREEDEEILTIWIYDDYFE